MNLLKLELSNYRNFSNFSINFPKRRTIICAPNATGKSNLLEAIYMLSYPRPIRDIKEIDLIQWNSIFNWTSIKGIVEHDKKEKKLEIIIQKTSDIRASKTLKINDLKKKGTDFIGNFYSILFSPITLNILILSPSSRRSFLDRIISQLSIEYSSTLTDYIKVVKNKNKLLYQFKNGNSNLDELDFWNIQLVLLGDKITQERQNFFDKINESINSFSNSKHLKLFYKASKIDNLQTYITREIEAGQCLVGPHRDDWILFDGERNLSTFGSRGEQRMGMLNFQFSLYDLLLNEKKAKSVLLLDDVASELDNKNLEILISNTENIHAQIIITTASSDQFDKDNPFEVKDLIPLN